MKAALILVAALAQAIQPKGLPPLPPHMHYEIILHKASRSDNPSPMMRLYVSCTMAKAITARTKGRRDPILNVDLVLLRHVACDIGDRN